MDASPERMQSRRWDCRPVCRARDILRWGFCESGGVSTRCTNARGSDRGPGDDHRVHFGYSGAAGLCGNGGRIFKSHHFDCRGAEGMSVRADPIELAIFQSAVYSIAEEMGAALLRTALSPNIRERRDYSCAVFDGQARVIAMGDHMPVHLGSMPMSVEAAIAAIDFAPGDIAILNDPYAGGTHLPDITMVLPVFPPGHSRPAFYVANRAHHADVGGSFPGSMGPGSEIFQEGLRIPPVQNCARRGDRSRDARPDPAECSHRQGARRRFAVADRRLSSG